MPKITEIYAYISDDSSEGDEGIVAYKMGDKWMPLIGADKDRAESIRHLAKITANVSGKPVKLIKLSVREDLGYV